MKFDAPHDDRNGSPSALEKETNISWWEKTLQDPPPLYVEMFKAQEAYLREHIAPDSKVLDIGCGEGRNTKTILGLTQNVVAIDIDQKAVEDAKRNLKDFPSVEILQADAAKLPFENGTFDCVVFFDTLVNLDENKIQALKEMKRVLKEGGKAIVSVYSDDAFEARVDMYKRVGVPILRNESGRFIFGENEGDIFVSEQFTKEDIEKMAEEAGMKVVGCVHVKGITYICELK